MKNLLLKFLPKSIRVLALARIVTIACAAGIMCSGHAAPTYYKLPANAPSFVDTTVTMVRSVPGTVIAEFAVVQIAIRPLSIDGSDVIRSGTTAYAFWQLPPVLREQFQNRGMGTIVRFQITAADAEKFAYAGVDRFRRSPRESAGFAHHMEYELISVQSPRLPVVAATLAMLAQNTDTLNRTGSGNYYQQANPAVIAEIVKSYFHRNANASPIHQEISAELKRDKTGDFLGLTVDHASSIVGGIKASRNPKVTNLNPGKHPQTIKAAAEFLLKEHAQLWGQPTELGEFLGQPRERFAAAINVATPSWPFDKMIDDVISHCALSTNTPLLKDCGTSNPAIAARIILDAAYTRTR